MNSDENLFPGAPDMHDAFDTSKDSVPAQEKPPEPEADEETYDKPEPVLKPTLTPDGGMEMYSDMQAEISAKGTTEQSSDIEHVSEKPAEEKSRNIDDILNRASVMLNEDWQKATGLEADSTEGYEP
jgi:hypothetical protein